MSQGKKWVSLSLFLLALNLYAKTKQEKPKLIGVFYYQNIFGHVHQNPSRYSGSLTTLACGHPVKVYQAKISKVGWSYTGVGAHKGYIQSEFLLKKRPNCFQRKYPKFFNYLDLDISELYFWGKLYDQYVMGKSEVR